MKLSVLERVVLFNLLPREGNFATLRAVRQLREAISLTDEERKAFGVRVDGDTITWERSEPKEIGISESDGELIVQRLKALDAAEKLTEQHYELYERFVN